MFYQSSFRKKKRTKFRKRKDRSLGPVLGTSWRELKRCVNAGFIPSQNIIDSAAKRYGAKSNVT